MLDKQFRYALLMTCLLKGSLMLLTHGAWGKL